MGYLALHDDLSPASMRKALFFASAMGSFCVEGIGTEKVAACGARELGRSIEQFRALVDYGGKLEFLAETGA